MATINNTNSYTLLSGTSSNDSIDNYGSKVTINAGGGNDYIYNSGKNVSIDDGGGNDYIDNYSSQVTINAGVGNDYIWNSSDGSLTAINAGVGNDYIYNYGSRVTINAGKGNDKIYNNCYREDVGSIYYYDDSEGYGSNVVFNYKAGDGNDIIYGFKADSTLSIGGGSYSTTKNGDNIIVTVGKGKITLDGAASLSAVNISGTKAVTEKNKWTISGTTATYGTSSKILATVSGVKSLDGISLSGKVVTVAKSSLNNSKVTISNGYTLALGSNVDKTATTSKAWSYSNSTATYKQTNTAYYSLAGDKKSITYNKASSKNLLTVSGVKSSSGLSVSGKTVTVAQAALGTSKVTVSDGYTLALGSNVNKTSTTSKAWSYSNSTATYKQTTTAYYALAGDKKSITYNKASNKNLVTVSGVKSSSGLSVSGKTVTVAQSALSTNKITISDGYTLKLADGVPISKATSVGWTHDGNKATYKSAGTTAGYILANNAITYSSAKTASALATVNGIKANVNPTVKNKIITLTKNNLSSNKVTVNGNGYEFNFAKGDYKKTAITGSANKDIITSRGNNLSIAGGKGNDTVKVFGNKTTITGGAGNDFIHLNSAAKNNLIVYSKGDGNDIIKGLTADDTIKISGTAKVTTSGSDVILTVGNGKITVKDAKDKTFTYIANGETKTYTTVAAEPYTIKGKGVTLSGSYSEETFDVSEVEGGSSINTIDAGNVTNNVRIIGNSNDNLIRGGKGNDTLRGDKGNDTLKGGNGADIFIYYNGNDNDVITDYEDKDTIKIYDAKVTPTLDGSDVVLKVGTGKIIVKDAREKTVGVTYMENGVEQGYIDGEQTVLKNKQETAATITANYWKSNFDFSTSTSIATLDASSAAQALTIAGNRPNNSINGSVYNDYINSGAGNDTIEGNDGNDTIEGGTGNDTLQGGDGKDIFVYSSGDGDDFIVDYRQNDDTIWIKSGTINDAYVFEGNVILKIGSGRITIKDGKGKPITIKDSSGVTTTETYKEKSPSNVAESWFVADDTNYELAPNNLSSIVQNNSIDYSLVNTSTKLFKETDLIAYAKEK